jgi:hypothetical protein
MPSSLRVLYHGLGSNDLRTIDRPAEQSITEFAPGAIKTKDKGFYESVGLTIPMTYRSGNRKGIYSMDKFDKDSPNPNKFDALEFSYSLNYNPDNSISNIGEYINCNVADGNNSQLDQNQIRLVIPKAFRTLKIEGNKGLASDNSDTKSSFSSSTIFAKEASNSNYKLIQNCKASLFGVFEDSKGEIWHINDNNGNYFKGHSSGSLNGEPLINGGAGYSFVPNFIIDKYELAPPNEFSGKIALGVKKTTEMLKLELNEIPEEICLNIMDAENDNTIAIKAAFYSAAFIIQRSLAHDLDIQPSEIEISELKINQVTGVPYLFISDSLPNGAGFVSYLLDEVAGETNFQKLITKIVNGEHHFIKSMVGDKHMEICKTSCQKCLNTYDNAGYHHVLDWRLGIGILRLMIDKDFKFGYDANLDYPELKDLIELINNTSTTYGKITNKKVITGEYGLSFIQKNDAFSSENSFVKHPLWNQIKIQNNTETFLPGVKIDRWLNFFNLLRLPASSN